MSRYSILLSKIIAESPYTASEIVKKCNEMGNKIDISRLSRLQSGSEPAPSEKVSRDIARACETDERMLVIEGYIEKSPKEISDAFIIIKKYTALGALKAYENIIEKEQLNIFLKMIENEPISDTVIDLLDYNNINDINLYPNEININTNNFKFTLENPISFPINDNSMSPLISKNSRVTIRLQEKYENSDILLVKVKGTNDIIARYAFFNENNISLIPLNKDFETITYNVNRVVIIGKIIKIITNL